MRNRVDLSLALSRAIQKMGRQVDGLRIFASMEDFDLSSSFQITLLDGILKEIRQCGTDSLRLWSEHSSAFAATGSTRDVASYRGVSYASAHEATFKISLNFLNALWSDESLLQIAALTSQKALESQDPSWFLRRLTASEISNNWDHVKTVVAEHFPPEYADQFSSILAQMEREQSLLGSDEKQKGDPDTGFGNAERDRWMYQQRKEGKSIAEVRYALQTEHPTWEQVETPNAVTNACRAYAQRHDLDWPISKSRANAGNV